MTAAFCSASVKFSRGGGPAFFFGPAAGAGFAAGFFWLWLENSPSRICPATGDGTATHQNKSMAVAMRTPEPTDKLMMGNLEHARAYGNSAPCIAPPIL